MGLAASQARLLFITARQNDVSARMQKISSANMVLARDEDDVMTKYNQMVNATIRQPVDTLSISYDNLMGARAYKTNTINLVTDTKTGAVLLNSTILGGLPKLGGERQGSADTFKLAYPDLATFKADLEPVMDAAASQLTAVSTTLDSDKGDWDEFLKTDFIPTYGEYPNKKYQTNLTDLLSNGNVSGYRSSILSQNLSGFGNKDGCANRIESVCYQVISNMSKALGISEAGMQDTLASFVSELKTNAQVGEYPTGDSTADETGAKNRADEKARANLVGYCHEHSTWVDGSADYYRVNDSEVIRRIMEKISELYTPGNFANKNADTTLNGTCSLINTQNDLVFTYNDKGYSQTEWLKRLEREYTNRNYENLSKSEAIKMAKNIVVTDTKEGGNGGATGYCEKLYNALAEHGWTSFGDDEQDKFQNSLENGDYMVGGQNVKYTDLYEEVADEETRAKAETYYNQEMKKIQRKEKMLDNELTKLNTEYSALTNDYNSVKGILDANIQKSFTYCQTG